MKNILAILLAFTLALSSSFATGGDPNIDGGGGGMGDGDKTNSWFVGNDGIRVTVVRESSRAQVTEPVDFSNIDTSNIEMHFVKKSKIQYNKGSDLALSSRKYKSIDPPTPLPTVISSSGKNNIQAVKDYFCDEGNLKGLSIKLSFDYTKLISGDYVILLEPIAYFTYGGYKCAMTATEAALHDQTVSGDLKKNMGYLTHQNLPLAMFLEKPDIGYEPWTGATSGIRANSDIISSLGMGTVRFSEAACCNHAEDCACIITGKPKDQCRCKELHPSKPCGKDTPNCDCVDKGSETENADYKYHTDTDVITSAILYNNSDEGISPDNPATVTFTIDGKSYTADEIIIAPNDSQLVWVKWHTPKTPKLVNISLRASGGTGLSATNITAAVTELVESTPPNTEGRDRNDNFKLKSIPDFGSSSHHNWEKWWAWWFENWVWVPDLQWVEGSCDSSCPPNCGGHGSWVDNGEWVDKGWWEYELETYYAAIQMINTDLFPDERVKTEKPYYNTWEMKSGYGVNTKAKIAVSSDAGSGAVTPAQNVVALFPEFDYGEYNRLLVPSRDNGSMTMDWEFRSNELSQFKNPVHFTPIWYPDKLKYEVALIAIDAWTPMGQLYMTDSDYIRIDGNVYDDWHIAPY